MSWFTGALDFATDFVPGGDYIDKAVTLIETHYGAPSGPCPNAPPTDMVQRVRTRATAAELSPIVQHWNRGRGRAPFYSADLTTLSRWIGGGEDCQHSDPQGRAIESAFWNLAGKYGLEAEPTASAGGWGPTSTPTSTPSGYVVPDPVGSPAEAPDRRSSLHLVLMMALLVGVVYFALNARG